MRKLYPYLLCILFIVGWWALAFKPKSITTAAYDNAVEHSTTIHEPIHHVDRQQLQQALAGDFALMGKLIVEWEIDAQLQLQKRLASERFVRSQWLCRQLHDRSPSELALLAERQRLKSVVDDQGVEIPLARPFQSFLPQTYSAASFLLALTKPKEIVALPQRLREQTQLYPKSLTDQIPLDIERHNSEKLFQAKPEIAFIAHYSHPATIQTLANQGILLYTMKTPFSLSDISDELMRVGHIVNRPLEAELMNIFMEAAIIAIENKFLAQAAGTRKRHVLFLNYHQGFSLPTTKTLTGQLLIKISELNTPLQYIGERQKAQEWRLPIDKEQLLNMNPDSLIIATESPEAIGNEMYTDHALKQLSAVQNNHLYFVDEIVQESPSQYIVLAYFDLVQAISKLL